MKVLILLCDCAVAGVVVWALNTLALIPFRRAKAAHWTERARVLYPARVAARTAIWLVPANLAMAQQLIWPDATPPWMFAALAAIVGTIGAMYPFEREILRGLSPRAWLRGLVSTWVFFLGVWLFLGVAIVLMPAEMDWRAWLVAILFVGLYLVWCWGGLLWVGRKLGMLAPASERLRRIVDATAGRMGVSVRGVWLLRHPRSYAFALPYTGDLAFSERLLEHLADDEVAAICAHELGHLAESSTTVGTRVFGNLAWLVPWVFLNPLGHAFEGVGFLVIGGCSLIAMRGVRWFTHRLEKRADKIAQANEGEAGTYARALAGIYEDNLIPAVLPRRRRTHPDLYDRMLAAGVQPDFPRPGPPLPNAVHGFILLGIFGFLIVITLTRVLQAGPANGP